MAYNDAEEHEQKEVLQALLNSGQLENNAAIGVTKKVIAEGESSLSEGQTKVFGFTTEKFLMKKCYRCSELIPISELESSWSSDLCSSCEYQLDKEDK